MAVAVEAAAACEAKLNLKPHAVAYACTALQSGSYA
jgi:hypothetical protein